MRGDGPARSGGREGIGHPSQRFVDVVLGTRSGGQAGPVEAEDAAGPAEVTPADEVSPVGGVVEADGVDAATRPVPAGIDVADVDPDPPTRCFLHGSARSRGNRCLLAVARKLAMISS